MVFKDLYSSKKPFVMKPLKYIISLVTLLIILGCASTNQILSEHDNTINFKSYTTFVLCADDFMVNHVNHPNLDNNHVRGLIGNEIVTQMSSLGYKNNTLKPELQAGFKIDITEEKVTFSNCDTEGEIDYWKSCTINTAIYTNETLIVSVSDITKNQVIWQASIACALNKSKTALPKYIASLVKQLFEQFPIKLSE